eukprot:6194536-Pleurochrysis_carterae.AAC.1
MRLQKVGKLMMERGGQRRPSDMMSDDADESSLAKCVRSVKGTKCFFSSVVSMQRMIGVFFYSRVGKELRMSEQGIRATFDPKDQVLTIRKGDEFVSINSFCDK